MFTKLYAATWGDVGKAKEKGFFDFDLFSWMAWTWQTAAFFIFIALCITVMLIWEKKVPGGSPRKGILGLDTTSCLLYTSPSPRDRQKSRMPSSA